MGCIALGLVQVPAHNLGLWWRLLRSSIRVAVRGQVVVALLDQGPLAHPRCRVERSVPQHYPASLHKHFVTFFLDDVLVGGDVAVVALVDDLLGALLLLALLHPLLLLLHHHAHRTIFPYLPSREVDCSVLKKDQG